MDTEQIKVQLETMLKAKRYEHTLSVAELAIVIGKHLKLDHLIDQLELAGLLHDCAKGMTVDEQIEYAEQYKIPLSHHDMNSRGVIHARVGRHIAYEQFGVRDPKVLRAIYVHPTGSEWMSTFDKILFAADYLDPTRKIEESSKILSILYDDFEQGVFEVVCKKNLYVEHRRKYMHPASIAFYNSQLLQIQKS